MRSVKRFVYLVLLAWPTVLAAQNAAEKMGVTDRTPVNGANAPDSLKQKIAALEARIKSLERARYTSARPTCNGQICRRTSD